MKLDLSGVIAIMEHETDGHLCLFESEPMAVKTADGRWLFGEEARPYMPPDDDKPLPDVWVRLADEDVADLLVEAEAAAPAPLGYEPPADEDASITRAISIRQPYVELILRGEKRVEFRGRPTTHRGQVYLYASATPADDPDSWEEVGVEVGSLPTGVVVGTVEIMHSHASMDYEGEHLYILRNPRRLSEPLTPINQPQPSFWRPQFAGHSLPPKVTPKKAPRPSPTKPPGRSASESASKAGQGITGDLVCYHNPDNMGTEVYALTDAGPLSAICARRYQGAEGKRIWLVTGRDSPRRYYLAGWFLVDSVDPVLYEDGAEDFRYWAGATHVATRFYHLVEIGTEPWFMDFRRACANFATMQHVRDVGLIKHLEAAWERTRAGK